MSNKIISKLGKDIYTCYKKGINLLNLRYNLKTRIVVKAEGCC